MPRHVTPPVMTGSGRFVYEWIEPWASLPDTPATRENGRTHGVAVTRDGLVVVFAQTRPAVLFYSPHGTLEDAWGEQFPGAHGLTLVEEDGREFLWLTDHDTGAVLKTTLSGEIVMAVDPPEVSPAEPYKPTSVAVHPRSRDVYVADGYGTNVIRRYGAGGTLLGELTGLEGPGRFARPHGIAFSPGGELWISDRRNQRVLVYDGEGRWVSHADGVTHSPCNFAFHHDAVFVPELFGAVKILDRSLKVLAVLGANDDVRPPEGWPDQQDWGWPTLEGWPDLGDTPASRRGRFSSPHDVAVSAGGDLYVVEWTMGGRIVKLARGGPENR